MTVMGFTMAEILLSLTIIGVVAAITLPSLTGNINERTWNTQRKALYARMSQAISLMPALNGYGTLKEATSSASAVDTATETFLTDGLAKVLKINNICDNAHLPECGIVSNLTTIAANSLPMPSTLYELDATFSSRSYDGEVFSAADTKAAAFETQNGESIIAFYNPSCRTQYLSEANLNAWGNTVGFIHQNVCLNFIYDLNGSKGPNTVGKDIGIMTVFNATDSTVVAPMPSSTRNAGEYKWQEAGKACTNENSESRLPNIDELSAMWLNRNLFDLSAGWHIWSSSTFSTSQAWVVDPNGSVRCSEYKSTPHSVRCIKR